MHAERDKSIRLLDWLLRSVCSIAPVTIIHQSPICTVTSQSDIHATFISYHKALYDPPATDQTINIQTFLGDLVLPTLDQSARKDLLLLLREQELRASIRGLATGKTPILDGLPVEFYQAYEDIVVPKIAGVGSGGHYS
ncbi:hypothetical protein NDU88_002049 [Pleurodeles waltl]|uniref:Uncharacterized protein n=1 Tax=Pleurodeles waltl TaxID=8319 RepID=A0AAV7P7N4_PLEWA|nr:hypothetical protein NDU88_002049 [Pleurodeles waltl]